MQAISHGTGTLSQTARQRHKNLVLKIQSTDMYKKTKINNCYISMPQKYLKNTQKAIHKIEKAIYLNNIKELSSCGSNYMNMQCFSPFV